MNRLVFRNDAPVFIPHLYDTFHAERRKDGSMYTQTAFPVIDLAGTGRSIERHRRDAGLTVRDLQTYFGFEYPQAIYKWQHGECLPTVDNLLALAKLLQVSMEDLLVYEDQEVSPVLGLIKEAAASATAPFLNINHQICNLLILNCPYYPSHMSA